MCLAADTVSNEVHAMRYVIEGIDALHSDHMRLVVSEIVIGQDSRF